ncbi:MAG: ATP-binding protein [Leptolyngbya sp. SIO4C1]|nr:ATP-binding protein [Leptolyngbya sp. SIO4C1]
MTNSSPPPQDTPYQSLMSTLKQLKLRHFLDQWQPLAQQATQEHWSYAQFLLALAQGEASRREQNRIARALAEAQLPYSKSWTNFEFDHVPSLNPAAIMELAQTTEWLETGCNLLVFGPSGTGKTHLCAALGRSIVELGKRVKFVTATALVQQLQLAKLQLELQPLLAKLDRYDLLIIDDLGYVKKSDSETSVLFELIAHRYERKSLMISANQPFSQWDQIFTDSMMTVAAIDRLVHHATIVECQAQSFRKQAADKRANLKPSSASA